MEIIIQEHWYSIQEVLENKDKVYVFGDNTIRLGKGGQAQIRDCPNAYGVATKRVPTTASSAFFTGENSDLLVIQNDIARLIDFAERGNYKAIVFPVDGLGTGLSELPQRAPKAFQFLSILLAFYFGIDTDPITYKLSLARKIK